MSQRHTISILLENEAGALSRVAGLFSARAYNIESLAVAPTEDPSVSRMTLVTSGSPEIIEQITKQLNKLVDVIRLVDLNERDHIERELLLVKLLVCSKERRVELELLAEKHDARIVDTTESSCTMELSGSRPCLNHFIDAIETNQIMETVRSGVLGLFKGDRVLKV